jgi:hypothetical protein
MRTGTWTDDQRQRQHLVAGVRRLWPTLETTVVPVLLLLARQRLAACIASSGAVRDVLLKPGLHSLEDKYARVLRGSASWAGFNQCLSRWLRALT